MTTITAVITIIITIEVRKKKSHPWSIKVERERQEVEEFHLKKGIEKKKNDERKKHGIEILFWVNELHSTIYVDGYNRLLLAFFFGDMESQIKIDSLQLNFLYVCSWDVGKRERIKNYEIFSIKCSMK